MPVRRGKLHQRGGREAAPRHPAALAGLAVALLAGASVPPAELPREATAQGLPVPVPVLIAGYSFVSPVVVVPAGTTVLWQDAPDGIQHSVTSDGGTPAYSGPMEDGKSYSYPFTQPGIFQYYCGVHGSTIQPGVVIVTASAEPPDVDAPPPEAILDLARRAAANATRTVNDTAPAPPDPSSQQVPDNVPPGAILDLSITDESETTLTITFTAPGDDGNLGTAASYDVRVSTSNFSAVDFEAQAEAEVDGTPKPAGSLERIEVPGLDAETEYFLAVRAIDEAGNEGPPSLTVSGVTLALPDSPELPPDEGAAPPPVPYLGPKPVVRDSRVSWLPSPILFAPTHAVVGPATFRWTAVVGAESYRLERAAAPTFASAQVPYEGPATDAASAPYTPGVYFYRVRAVAGELESLPSAPVVVTHLGASGPASAALPYSEGGAGLTYPFAIASESLAAAALEGSSGRSEGLQDGSGGSAPPDGVVEALGGLARESWFWPAVVAIIAMEALGLATLARRRG